MINPFRKQQNIIPLLEAFVNDVKCQRVMTRKNSSYSSNSYQPIHTAMVHFKEFCGEKPFYIDFFTKDFIKKYSEFLNSQQAAMNSVFCNVKNLRSMIKRLVDDEIIRVPKGYVVPDLNLPKEITTAVYNTEEELQQLAEIDLELLGKLKRVRDVYIMQCYTGLRFSDMQKIIRNPKAYYREESGKYFFTLNATKTNQQLVIPLKPVVVTILKEHKFNFGNGFSVQHYNKVLKELAEYAGIGQEVVKYITIGGKRKEIVKEKWQMMSSHTARRTFATNAYLNGVPSSFIRKITGHTTEESLMRYIRASGLDVALKIHDYDFFR